MKRARWHVVAIGIREGAQRITMTHAGSRRWAEGRAAEIRVILIAEKLAASVPMGDGTMMSMPPELVRVEVERMR